MRIVMPGGSGFLGRHLAARLVDRGDEVVVLTRGAERLVDGVQHVHWDGRTIGPWAAHLDGADAVVHLAGERVGGPPTKATIERLITSRVASVAVVGEALATVASPPPVWVQAGTLAVHGDSGDTILHDDTAPTGLGPPQMVQVALAWEAAHRRATADVERTVLLRIGICLGDDDPATARLAQLARLGLGGPIGGGRQWVSWIALPDLLDVLVRAIDDPSMAGTLNVTAPDPVTNAELMAAVRRGVGRRVGLPSPAWLTQVGARLLGSDPALALTGRRAVPTRLLDAGVTFAVTDLDRAVAAALA